APRSGDRAVPQGLRLERRRAGPARRRHRSPPRRRRRAHVAAAGRARHPAALRRAAARAARRGAGRLALRAAPERRLPRDGGPRHPSRGRTDGGHRARGRLGGAAHAGARRARGRGLMSASAWLPGVGAALLAVSGLAWPARSLEPNPSPRRVAWLKGLAASRAIAGSVLSLVAFSSVLEAFAGASDAERWTVTLAAGGCFSIVLV